MLDIRNCCLAVVDVQGKLAQLMHGKDALFKNIQVLVQAANILDIPILWCQQVPDALGPTVPEIARLLADIEPMNKSTKVSDASDLDARVREALEVLHLILSSYSNKQFDHFKIIVERGLQQRKASLCIPVVRIRSLSQQLRDQFHMASRRYLHQQL